MERIIVNQAFNAVFPIQESKSTDTVTYTLRKLSDGSTVSSGSATYVAGVHWKVTFTPTVLNETYLLDVDNTTLDVQYSNVYQAVSGVTLSSPVAAEDDDEEPTTAEMLTNVKKAINRRVAGGAVQSYSVSGGRNIQYMSLPDLMKLKGELESQLAAEQGSTRNYASF